MMTTKSGLIVFKPVNPGSKSEHEAPFLIVSDEEPVRLYFKGDNPFRHDTLRKYQDKPCELTGEYDERKKRFLVLEIVQVPADEGKPEENDGGGNG